MKVSVITQPIREPVTLSEAREELRIDFATDDFVLRRKIRTAREMAERQMGRSIITQTLRLSLDEFPGADFKLPFGPVQEIDAFEYVEDGESAVEVDPDSYELDVEAGRLVLKSGSAWPSVTLGATNGVTVEYVAGFGDFGTDVPQTIRDWILATVGTLYHNREGVTTDATIVPRELPFVDALLAPHRIWSF